MTEKSAYSEPNNSFGERVNFTLDNLSPEQIEQIFPFFIKIDRSGSILKMGRGLEKWAKYLLHRFFEDFTLISPKIPIDQPDILMMLEKENLVFGLDQGELILEGLFRWLGNYGYFLLNPRSPEHHLTPSLSIQLPGKQSILQFDDQSILLKHLLDNSSDAVQIADETGTLIYINDEASRRLGIPKNQCNNFQVKDFEKAFEVEGSWFNHLKELEKVDSMTMEGININQKTGYAFPVEVTVKLLRLNHKNYVIANSRDISERKRFETKLNQELKLQEALVDIASTYINLDINEVENTLEQSLEKMGRFVDADRAFIFNYDFENNTISNTHEWYREGLEMEIKNLQQVSISDLQEYVDLHANGVTIYVDPINSSQQPKSDGLYQLMTKYNLQSLIAVPLLDQGELTGFVSFISIYNEHVYSAKERQLLALFGQLLINIRNREHSEKSLKIHEEKYRNLINNMNMGLLEVDKDDVIQFANQSFCDLSGFSLSELVGNKALDLLPVKNKDLVRQKTSLREQGLSDSYEVEIYTKSGEPRFWLISGAANYNDKGIQIGSIGMHLDITDLKRMEIELAKAKGSAEAAAIAKDIFLANMSHEIRTPLNIIIGMIRMLQQENLSPQQKYYVSQSNASARHLLTILNNVLDVAKIESGKLNLEYEYTSLSALINNVHSIMYSQVKEKDLDLKLNYDPQIHPALKIDSTRLRQVLFNLLGNAIKFTDAGTVSISVVMKENKDQYQKVYFEVSDTGIGMSDEFIAQIFNKFSQEHNLANRKFEGTGLGMAISADLIKLMGGKLKVDSKKNQGSRFWFDLTLKKGNPELLLETLPDPVSSFPNKVVLLVEDNTMNRLIARHSLENLNLQVIEAQNGQEAIETLEMNPCDLILMDIQMPIMDGVEATKVIRNKIGLTTPIIALTANAFKHDIDRYLESGMNDFITKPYDERNFVQVITRNLQTIISSETWDSGMLSGQEQLPSDSPLYDLRLLKELTEGDMNFFREMIEIFIDQSSKECKNIQEALKTHDIARINQIAHKIKPNIQQLGISSLKDPILTLESYDLTSGSPEQMQSLVNQVCNVLAQVSLQLQEQLNSSLY